MNAVRWLAKFSTRRVAFVVALLYVTALLLFTPFREDGVVYWLIALVLMWGNFAFIVWFFRYKPKRQRESIERR